MTLKNIVTTVIFCVVWSGGISATSYSQVYVKSGSNEVPYQYGSPAVSYGPPASQLTAATSGSLAPLPQGATFIPPCPSPCISTQQLVPVANAGLVAYKAYNAPVVVAKDDPPTQYQYSYAVYDDNTGDQKAQKELSDNGLVRGQYSFLQPDGYVRQVQYTADDTTGFNAVINYLLPPGITVDAKQAKNCDEPKSDDLKVSAKLKEPAPSNALKQPSKTESPAQSAKTAATDEKKEDTTQPPASRKNPSSPSPRPRQQSSTEVKENKPVGEFIETNAVVTPVASPQTPQAFVPPTTVPIGYFSYDQLLNCLQKMQQLKNNSPLTYIILPSRPC